jgi:hypothetical protein
MVGKKRVAHHTSTTVSFYMYQNLSQYIVNNFCVEDLFSKFTKMKQTLYMYNYFWLGVHNKHFFHPKRWFLEGYVYYTPEHDEWHVFSPGFWFCTQHFWNSDINLWTKKREKKTMLTMIKWCHLSFYFLGRLMITLIFLDEEKNPWETIF